MSIHRSDDLNADIDARLKEEQEWEDRLPKCHMCRNPIDDNLFDIDGEILCYDCMVAKYSHDVEGYMI